MQPRTFPRIALLLLTALNFVNYVDRNVLFAIQDLVKAEFRCSDTELGFLTTAFFFSYMVTAPIAGLAADRFPRRLIMAGGAVAWSVCTLLTAVTHDFGTLLVRHTLVGVGEATFVAIAPAFLSDMFPENRRGRVLSIFYLAIPVGSACGYLLGGYLGHRFGWRSPFYVGAAPGFLLAIGLFLIPEPVRGSSDRIAETRERGTLLGLFRNKAYWTCTFGMAMMTFAVGGLQVWMPTFLSRVRGVPLPSANRIFGSMTLVTGLVATLFGGFLGDRLLRRTPGAHYLVSGIGMAVALPAMALAIHGTGAAMYPGILLAEFFLLINTAPLNAALVNSVGASVRATAVAVNVFVIHLLGDAFSPTLIGWISDRSDLKTGFAPTLVAVALSAAILLVGTRFAPPIPLGGEEKSRGVPVGPASRNP
jgi:MFS transporter, Spinster family, sphingosine-1-phosphate transporter